MTGTADRLEFAPPRDKASPRAFGLALLVHVLLISALTWGVNWKRTDDAASFEAEVWSGIPQSAAPRQIQAPPPQPPAPAPEPAPPVPSVPAPPPAPAPPVAKAPEIKETPPVPDVDIALEREKKRKLLQQQKDAEVLKAQRLQEKREAELQARQTREQDRKKEKEQQAREELAERKTREVAEKAEAKKQEARQLANEKQKDAAAAAEKQKQAAATAAANAEKQKEAAASAAVAKQKAAAAAGAEKDRQTAIQKRIMDMAGAGGGSGPAGAGAGKASGPSAGYAGKVRAKVLPNVVFNDDIAGNPKAEVEVTTTLDGTIMSQRLLKSSGNKAWDDAVIKAIVRTGSLPRDDDGRVPTPMIIEFRPN